MRKALITGLIYALPALAFAQTFGTGGGLTSYLKSIVNFANNVIIPLIIAAAILFFIWGMFQYFILGGADEEKRSKGKQLLIWSVVGLVLMLSIQGIVNMASGAFGFGSSSSIQTPQLPGF